MVQLNVIIGSIVRSITEAQIVGDKLSQAISEEYKDDEILRIFPVPRAEIKNINIQLKFSINSVDSNVNNPDSSNIDIAILKEELKDIKETTLSNISIDAGIRNYQWVQVSDKDQTQIRILQPE